MYDRFSRDLTDSCFVSDATFELINQYDTKGRLFGAFRVASAGIVGAVGTSYKINVELRQRGTLLGCREVTIASVAETMLAKVGARVKDFARSNSRMWGRTKFDTVAEVEQVVAELEAANGSFSSNALYTWTGAEKANSPELKARWEDAISKLGGLGKAYYDKDGLLDEPMLKRIKHVLPEAFIQFGRVVPLDAQDYMGHAEYEALDDPWLKDIPCAGFTDTTNIADFDYDDATHQWRLAGTCLCRLSCKRRNV